MKKSFIIKVILGISLGYLVAQFVLIPLLLSQEKSKSPAEVPQRRKKIVQDLLTQSAISHLPLVLLELDILQQTFASLEIIWLFCLLDEELRQRQASARFADTICLITPPPGGAGARHTATDLCLTRDHLKLVRGLLTQSALSHLPLVVLELDILQQTFASPEIIRRLTERNFLTFGLFKENTPLLDYHAKQFEALGLTIHRVTQIIGEDERNVTTHYFLYTDVVTIHVVVLLRVALNIWHTGIAAEALPQLPGYNAQQPFLNRPGIFDRFEVVSHDSLFCPSPLAPLVHQLPGSAYIPCNHTQARRFLANHPQDSSEDSQRFQRKSRQILARAKQYLDDLGIPFWLSSGTCLGWYRQCSVISYSQDVDIGIFVKHYKPQLVPTFERGGFFLKNLFGKVSDSYELSFQAGEIKLDVFFFYEESDHNWNGGTHHETGQKYKYVFPKFNLCWTVFLELRVRVPCPTEPYIRANYGKNWSEPVKEWEWNKSPPNVRENGVWPREEWPDVIQVY